MYKPQNSSISMKDKVSKDTIEKWLRGWSLSRNLPLPFQYKSGFRINVDDEKQKIRYVFPELNDDFIQLSKSINEPWVYLKVCASADEIRNVIAEKWEVQPQGYMMCCLGPMSIPEVRLHDDYQIDCHHDHSTYIVMITTKLGEPVSIGRVVLVDDLAVYDRISTEKDHQRKGLATFLMKELEKIALSKGIVCNFLVATEQGKSLYEQLGWKIYSLYTSIVIPSES